MQIDCSRCFGKGYILHVIKTKCSSCSGSGVKESTGKRCGTCSGNGEIEKEVRLDHSPCNGTGKIKV